jgi:hypothetical protein
MKCSRCLSGVSLALVLLAAAPAYSEDMAAPSAFTYTDDWSLVSAPPPPGPYSAIHIDPRVPGQDLLPPLPVDNQPQQPWEEIQEITESTPPAAGTPAVVTEEKPLQQIRAPQTRPQSRMRPQQPAYNYPVPGHYPGRANYPGYRNMPPAGYYRSPYPQQAEEVPPPPVYDDLMRRSGVAR